MGLTPSITCTKPLSILDQSLCSLKSWCKQQKVDESLARVALYHVFHHPKGYSWDTCATLDQKTISLFKHSLYIPRLSISKEHRSSDGTIKWLFLDNQAEISSSSIETVFIPEKHRRTLCVSSQHGCAMSCTFCHTGAQGFKNNLSRASILLQVLEAKWRLRQLNSMQSDLTNVVFMGQGEPLLNYKNVKSAIVDGVDSLVRRDRIVVSTSGISPLIPRIATDLGVMLAVSLHAPNDQLRFQLMPTIARHYPLDSLITNIEQFISKSRLTTRRVTLEYIMLKDVNDAPQLALELAQLIKQKRLLRENVHINLIPFNPWQSRDNYLYKNGYSTSTLGAIKEFQRVLQEGHQIRTTIRRTRGKDIMAACGQLSGNL